ncbi:hypothetical protein AVEN_141376-1 [Araneus ventricosus]|uniref:Uncharacterized protein n=1 Tax=Araneus ventricosus TaxID=182803 RepID=A0A4Y2D020_ARAVE|nr:hypothetical protein AVEN_141376-1 [Araneus ventricosus]
MENKVLVMSGKRNSWLNIRRRFSTEESKKEKRIKMMSTLLLFFFLLSLIPFHPLTSCKRVTNANSGMKTPHEEEHRKPSESQRNTYLYAPYVSPFLLDVFVSLSSKCLPKSRWDLFLTLYLLDAPSKDILIDLTGSDRRTPTYARYVFVAAAEIWQRPRAGMYESLKADRCTGGK